MMTKERRAEVVAWLRRAGDYHLTFPGSEGTAAIHREAADELEQALDPISLQAQYEATSKLLGEEHMRARELEADKAELIRQTSVLEDQRRREEIAKNEALRDLHNANEELTSIREAYKTRSEALAMYAMVINWASHVGDNGTIVRGGFMPNRVWVRCEEPPQSGYKLAREALGWGEPSDEGDQG